MARKPRVRKIREPSPNDFTGNGFDPRLVTQLVVQIEAAMDDKATEHGEYMRRCQGINTRIDAVYDEGKARGVPKKELKANIQRRVLERKIEALREGLEGDRQDAYDLLRQAMGDLADTPLGTAASKAAGMPGADAPGTYN